MASTGSAFSGTLRTITNTKLDELAQQRAAFDEQYSTLVATAEAEHDPLRRLSILVDGAKACLNVKTTTRKNKDGGRRGRVILGSIPNSSLETDLSNLDRFLEQARYDPSVSPKVLDDWQNSILKYLATQSSKYQYADLYGKLVTEWLASEKQSDSDNDVEMSESFEEVPGAKKLESRKEWEKVVFEPATVNISALDDYLQNLFSTEKKTASKALDGLREQVEQFELKMSDSRQFDSSTLRWVIQGLQASDLLTDDKREALKDFLNNNVILDEIADVLNMRMSALNRWTWGDNVPLDQRRKLNGTYSVHMEEDLLQAIFLQYVGVQWSVFFKKAFSTLRDGFWISNHSTILLNDRKRREYYLGHTGVVSLPNLESSRVNIYNKSYFVHQLLDYYDQQIVVQEGEEEVEFDLFLQSDEYIQPERDHDRVHKQAASGRMVQSQSRQPHVQVNTGMVRQSAYPAVQQAQSHRHAARQTWGPQVPAQRKTQAKKPMEVKQDILHFLSSEIVINTRLHGQLTCLRSVFESWNPLLPHDTILAVLRFFGVSDKWSTFFKAFLQAPLKFIDDGDAAPRLRRRGTPGSHVLSDVFGEVVLFCLDFSINQSTNGGLLYRVHDDIWFWSHDYNKCAKAWESVLLFTKTMGVRLSDAKTGSARITQDKDVVGMDNALPQGRIRWGFLYLDPTSGHFEIDGDMVDSHVNELRKQLQSKSKSVIDWIQAWNSYAGTFFSSNFGKAANCFGREHVDKMLATHRRIQESIFEGGNVVQHLKKMIRDRFSVDNIPDGFLFFPVDLGGLDLKSPFVGLLQIREAVRDNPYDLMDDFEEAEQQAYIMAKDSFLNGDVPDQQFNYIDRNWQPAGNHDEFLTFEEFVRYRECLCGMGRKNLVGIYYELLKKPEEESIDPSVQVQQALGRLSEQENLKGIMSHWNGMTPYWKWVAQMYGPEMIAKFGGLNVVDPGLLPIGMVSMFRQRRTKWQG